MVVRALLAGLVLIVACTATAGGSVGPILGGVMGGDGSGTPPPPCGNLLDYSDACNSQYLGGLT